MEVAPHITALYGELTPHVTALYGVLPTIFESFWPSEASFATPSLFKK